VVVHMNRITLISYDQGVSGKKVLIVLIKVNFEFLVLRKKLMTVVGGCIMILLVALFNCIIFGFGIAISGSLRG